MGSYIFRFLGVKKFFMFTVSKRTSLYCRGKVKRSSFNLINGQVRKIKK